MTQLRHSCVMGAARQKPPARWRNEESSPTFLRPSHDAWFMTHGT